MYNQNNGMYSGYEVESSTSSSKESFVENKSVEMTGMGGMSNSSCCSYGSNYGYAMGGYSTMSMPCEPIYECPQERVIHREFVHEVPHIMPINTRIVNHHIYKHSYSPCYTCCEENCVSNVTDNCGCNF